MNNSREGCDSSEKIEDYSEYVKVVHFRNNELTDYVIYPADIMCASVTAMYGNGGVEVEIYSTLSSGKTKETFGHRLTDSKIVENNHQQELHLLLGGLYCEQNIEKTTKSEVTSCWRIVEWNDQKQEFELGKMYFEDKEIPDQ